MDFVAEYARVTNWKKYNYLFEVVVSINNLFFLNLQIYTGLDFVFVVVVYGWKGGGGGWC